MIIKPEIEIGVEGEHCWICPWNPHAVGYCDLFHVKLKRHCIGAPPDRCAACLDAENKTKENLPK